MYGFFFPILMPLFLVGCFPLDFQEEKRPLRTKSGKRPIEVGKRPIREGKRPIKVMVLVGISVGCLMGCFRATLPWQKTAPLKRPIKRSMKDRTIAIASDFRVDGAKSPEIPQKEWVSGSEIAARNRKSLASCHRTLKSQCSIALSCLGNHAQDAEQYIIQIFIRIRDRSAKKM